MLYVKFRVVFYFSCVVNHMFMYVFFQRRAAPRMGFRIAFAFSLSLAFECSCKFDVLVVLDYLLPK